MGKDNDIAYTKTNNFFQIQTSPGNLWKTVINLFHVGYYVNWNFTPLAPIVTFLHTSSKFLPFA